MPLTLLALEVFYDDDDDDDRLSSLLLCSWIMLLAPFISWFCMQLCSCAEGWSSGLAVSVKLQTSIRSWHRKAVAPACTCGRKK